MSDKLYRVTMLVEVDEEDFQHKQHIKETIQENLNVGEGMWAQDISMVVEKPALSSFQRIFGHESPEAMEQAIQEMAKRIAGSKS